MTAAAIRESRRELPGALRAILLPGSRARAVLAPFVLSRALLTVVTVLAALGSHRPPLNLWNQWDARWYIGIAGHGYHWGIAGKPALAFYPLYPLLVRALTLAGLSGLVAGMLIANVAFLAALWYLHALAEDCWSVQVARRTVWLITFLPTSFFFMAPYTESLFLLSAVGAVYHARRGESLRAGLWSAAALLTRPTGLVLLPAVLIALIYGRRMERFRSRWADHLLDTVARAVLPSVAGLGIYLAELSSDHITLSSLLTAQRGWHRSLTAPWTGFTASLQWLWDHGSSNIPWACENALQLTVTLVLLVWTLRAWPHLDRAKRAYCAGFWVLVLLTPEWRDNYYAPFSSMDRFVLVLFPLWMWAAAHLSPKRARTLLLASSTLMASAAMIHLTGGWIG